MSERPLLLFPEPQIANKDKGRPFPPKQVKKPNIQRQVERFEPVFGELTRAFESKNIIVKQSSIGINPEYALVFEVVGKVDDFYKAIQKINGLEWIFDQSVDNIKPDEDFYTINKDGTSSDENLDGRVYCVMSSLAAINDLLSMWRRYSNGEENVFPRGTASLKSVFQLLKNIRLWNAKDRIYETNAMEYWKEELELDGQNEVIFEVELFYRYDERKRYQSISEVSNAIIGLGGSVIKTCFINEIAYLSLLVSLPRKQIEELVNNYDNVSLVNVDGIMFFRPICQSVFASEDSSSPFEEPINISEIESEPIIAIFDGMPMQNHRLLKDYVIVDDPNEIEKSYQVKDRKHGTSMASLVIHGDFNGYSSSLNRKIYIRPIMKSYLDFHGNSIERVPEDIMIVDLIHEAVKRMKEGEHGENPTAPFVKIINLSIGDEHRQFAQVMSPLARLLDWLSYKYKILFIVSAGNQYTFANEFHEKFSDFKNDSIDDRTTKVFKHISDYKSYYRVLSPAETINSLTIGATYADYCEIDENQRQAYAVKSGLPSPISAIGFGYNKTINPDLYFNGGRKFLVEDVVKGKMKWLNNTYSPGCKSASPMSDGVTDGCAFTFGTSDAAAQITHEVGICYETLEHIFSPSNELNLPHDYIAVILKSMLCHSASWGSVGNELSSYVCESDKKLSRWLGNGIPDVARVQECAKNRVTLIGYGDLSIDEAHLYRLPLPFNFSTEKIMKKLTVTMAYMAPTNSSKQRYRSTKLWFDILGIDKLKLDRQNTDWQMVQKSTLQHEIFSGEKAVVWDENNMLEIKVSCKEDGTKVNEKIPYSLFVTFEVAEGIDLDVYTSIENAIKIAVPVSNN